MSISAEELAKLHALCFDRSWGASDFADYLSNPRTALFTHHQDAVLTSFVLIQISGSEAEILTLATHPDYRRKGHAEMVLHKARSRLQKGELTALFLEVAIDNPAAISLYQKTGFEKAGLRKAYYDRGGGHSVDAFVLRDDVLPTEKPV